MITVKTNVDELKSYEGVFHNKNEVCTLVENNGYWWASNLDGIHVYARGRKDVGFLKVSGDPVYEW